MTLKILNKEKFKDVNLIKEKEIISICKSDNILDIYRILETDNNFILEQEIYETNMHEYIIDNGPLNIYKLFFKKIAIELAKGFKILYDNKIMHRKIKSSSIFLKENNGKYEIKLGNFDEAIFFNENKSEPLDSFYYTAPEIINGDKYDEKCDLWSFGITLYDLYFGDLPYGYKPSKMQIIKALSSEDNFKYEKSNIPLLDAIFEGLLKINPDDRMSHKELFDIILTKDFIDKNIIYQKQNIKKLIIKSISLKKTTSKEFTIKKKNNNILYYDENKKYPKFVLKNCNAFEPETPGAFIFLPNEEIFNLIKEEIKKENKNNVIKFNLIIKGSDFKKINDIISEDVEFKNCIENKCIYCYYIEQYDHYKELYQDIIKDNIYSEREDIIDFIHKTSNEKINPFKIKELITYKKFSYKYHLKYLELLKYYNDLDDSKFKKYIKKLGNFLNKKEQKELKMDKTELLNEFKNISNDNFLSIFINKIYEDLNNFIIEDINIEDCIAYFTASIMTYFINYRNDKEKYYDWEKNVENKIYFGTNLKLSELLQYKRAKGLIQFHNFTIFYEDKKLAEKKANRKQSKQYYRDNLLFSVIFILKKKEINSLDSEGINIEDLCSNKEKAILFLPFSDFKLEHIDIDFSNYTADIFI